jgi:hypothetical protein
MNQVVDMLMMITLQDHDPFESPIVVLPCGHVFTVETLDGVLFMDTFYTREPEEGSGARWKALVPLDEIPNADLPKPICPHPGCSRRLAKVNRYGRVLVAIDVRDAQRKFIVRQRQQLQYLAQKLQSLVRRQANFDPKEDEQEGLPKLTQELEKFMSLVTASL